MNLLNRLNKQHILLAGIALLAIGLLANQWVLTALLSSDGQLSPRSVVIIWLFDITLIIVGLVLIISRSLGTLFNVFVGVALTVLLLIGLEKIVFYRLNHPPPAPVEAAEVESPAVPPPPAERREGSYTQGYFFDDELLGYKPKPNAQVDSVKLLGDEMVYNVVYSTDAYSRRITPGQDLPERNKHLIFFGDSFTFGEGVEDNETLPYYLSQLAPEYRAYNYGFSGYGPQQMLATLQSDAITAQIPEKEGIGIYVFIDAHVERAIGSMYVHNAWGAEMPYYTVVWSGNVEKQGNFTTGRPVTANLYQWLGDTEFARYYNLNIPGTLRAGHYWTTARIIAEARDTYKEKFNSDQFYVVVYPDEGDYLEDIGPYFEEFGLKVLNYDEWLKLDPDEGLAFKGDGHPTGKANRIVAQWIAADLGLAE